MRIRSSSVNVEIFVAFWLLIVTGPPDGLSRLPPIQLRPEGDTYKPRSPSLPPQPSTDPETPTPSGLRIPVGHESLDANEIASPVGPTRSRSPSGVSGSTSLSISPAESDPLNSIAQVQLKSPSFPQGTSEGAGSQSDLPGRTSPTVIEEAITDSVMTVTEPVTLKEVETIEPVKAVPSGADLILPIIIFAVVKSNPPQLASHLMFLRRYRSAICLTGEASYAIVNLTAVVEFLEHVDLAELGLGSDSDKVIRSVSRNIHAVKNLT